MSVAYSVLVNPAKRAQYDRDRLEYLYAHFDQHAAFPAEALTRAETTRDEQIQVYATTLADRVRDPLEEKKAAVQARAARTRAGLDEFHEKSDALRQEWATSPNEILRMAGNALREVVVCAEEDLLMLEDELGRLEGILAPTAHDREGPAGRVTSGQYGSDLAGAGIKGRHGLIATQRVPSLPRSPTMPVEPQSASKLGLQLEDASARGDSSSEDHVSPGIGNLTLGDRVGSFLLGGPGAMRRPNVGANEHGNFAANYPISGMRRSAALGPRGRFGSKTFSSLFHAPPTPIGYQASQRESHNLGDNNNNSNSNPGTNKDGSSSHSHSTLLAANLPPMTGNGMGLVEWQRMHGAQAFPPTDDRYSFWDSLTFKPIQIVDPSPESTSSARSAQYAAATSNNNATYVPDPASGAAEPVFRRHERPVAAMGGEDAGRAASATNEDLLVSSPSDQSPGQAQYQSQSFGFHISQPYDRHPTMVDPFTMTSPHAAATPKGGSNWPAPDMVTIPTEKQSSAIKDFQERVWKRAVSSLRQDEKKQEEYNGKDRSGGDKGKDASGSAGAHAERTREEFRRQMAKLTVTNAARETGARAHRAADVRHAGEGFTGPSSSGAAAGDELGGNVFRRSKPGAAAKRPVPDMDDPFI